MIKREQLVHLKETKVLCSAKRVATIMKSVPAAICYSLCSFLIIAIGMCHKFDSIYRKYV